MEKLEFKGTKGEWTTNNDGSIQINHKCEYSWSYSSSNYSPISREQIEKEVEANAKLIAASPDLLEALQYFLQEGENRHTIKKAEKAIEKALK